MEENSVDLIILDPPFETDSKGRSDPESLENMNYSEPGTPESGMKKLSTGKRKILKEKFPKVNSVLKTARSIHSPEMETFLECLAIRVVEVRRILKDTGNIYLECGSRGSHYSKQLMDAIFGKENFCNEIIWTIKKSYRNMPAQRDFIESFEAILHYSKTKDYFFNKQEAKSFPDNIWEDIKPQANDKTYKKYKIEKPIEIYERMIKASSQPNEIVLDPFAGTCSALVAAKKLNRQYIGIEQWSGATELLRKRLQR